MWLTNSSYLPNRIDTEPARIRREVELNEAEQKFTRLEVTQVEVGIEVLPSREVKVLSSTHLPQVQAMLQHFDPTSGVGAIHYLNPHREIPEHSVTTVQLNLLDLPNH